MLANKNMLANTTASPARVAGTKRNIDELCDDFTRVKIKKTITKTKLKKKRLDDLSLELSSMSMSSSSSSSSSSSPPPQKKLLDVDDDALRLIRSFLADPTDRRNLALTCHDFARTA